MQHYCWWNKYVANPIKKDGYQGPGRLAMRVLKEEILPAILLRRTKVQCADVLALPPRCGCLPVPAWFIDSLWGRDTATPRIPVCMNSEPAQPHARGNAMLCFSAGR